MALHCTTSALSIEITSPKPSRLSAATANSALNNTTPCVNFGRLFDRLLSLSRRRNQAIESSMKEGMLTGRHHKLRDLFICSSHPYADGSADHGSFIKVDHGVVRVAEFRSFLGRVNEQQAVRRQRFLSFELRYRLLRGA